MTEVLHTEGAVGAVSTAAARAADGSTGSQADAAPETVETAQDEAQAGESANVSNTPETAATAESGASDDAAKTPTDLEQADIDAMVDYTVTEETAGQFPTLPDGTIIKAGDIVKLPANHPLVAVQA